MNKYISLLFILVVFSCNRAFSVDKSSDLFNSTNTVCLTNKQAEPLVLSARERRRINRMQAKVRKREVIAFLCSSCSRVVSSAWSCCTFKNVAFVSLGVLVVGAVATVGIVIGLAIAAKLVVSGCSATLPVVLPVLGTFIRGTFFPML